MERASAESASVESPVELRRTSRIRTKKTFGAEFVSQPDQASMNQQFSKVRRRASQRVGRHSTASQCASSLCRRLDCRHPALARPAPVPDNRGRHSEPSGRVRRLEQAGTR